VVAVIRLAGAPRGVDHHDIQHTVAGELVEPLLPNSALGGVCEGAEAAYAPAGAWLPDKGLMQKSGTGVISSRAAGKGPHEHNEGILEK
jgi:hypothetical protein